MSGVASKAVAFADDHQIPIYLLALALGVVVGTIAPASSHGFEQAIEPVLALLLFATFQQVPFTALAHAFRDRRFLTVLLLVNFVVVPVVVFGLTRFVAGDKAVLIAVLLVLLTPCIDYVIVFCGLAGGASTKLLAASPILMLGQLLLLPLYLIMFVGRDLADVFDPGPFVHAFVVLIVVPLLLALLTEMLAARHHVGMLVTSALTGLMVALLAATLFVVVASQVPAVRGNLRAVAEVVPIFAAFAAVMAAVGWVATRCLRLDPADGRAVMFSGTTRNSLVVLPLALALPAAYDIAPAVVVTQTLVELIVMLVYVRLVPRLVRSKPEHF
ncbi:bile acid:sodium symporter [uncultured Jatrophihabitans sp.]|uniref:bile acid:sodium symporter n=1 Tax=uncultured Jatrophihabitans sp. TaxID=1610747 RepID=UPI0035CABC65